MAEEIKNAIVLGATGNLGPYVISSLQKAGFNITTLSRSPPSFEGNNDIKARQSDYTLPSLINVFKDQDAVVSLISTADVSQQETIIDAAVAAGVKRFLPSEFGSDTSVENLAGIAPLLAPKQEVVRYLRTKEPAGLSWTALCSGSWIDWQLEEGGLLGVDIKRRTMTILDSGDAPFTTSTISLVACATAAVLLQPEKTRNRYVHVHSWSLMQNDLLSAFERVSGDNKFSVTSDNPKANELFAQAKKHLDEGDFDKGYYEHVTAITFGRSKAVHFPQKAKEGCELLGLREEEEFDEMIRRVLDNVEKT